MIDHGTSHMTVHNPIGDLLEQTVEHFLTMLDKINCKEYYGVSQACTEWLKHFHIQAKGVLYNAINLEKIENVKKNPCTDYRKNITFGRWSSYIFYWAIIERKGNLTAD